MVAGTVVSGTVVLDEVVLEPVELLVVASVVEVDVGAVVLEEVVLVLVLAVVVVGSLLEVDGAIEVVVVGWVVVVVGDVVDELRSDSVVVVESSVGAGAMLPRPSRSSSTMPGRSIEVGDSGVVTGTVLPPILAAGSRSASTLTALRARGAATAAAVTVDSDRASQNRPRPAVSPGRCRYMGRIRTERANGGGFRVT